MAFSHSGAFADRNGANGAFGAILTTSRQLSPKSTQGIMELANQGLKAW